MNVTKKFLQVLCSILLFASPVFAADDAKDVSQPDGQKQEITDTHTAQKEKSPTASNDEGDQPTTENQQEKDADAQTLQDTGKPEGDNQEEVKASKTPDETEKEQAQLTPQNEGATPPSVESKQPALADKGEQTTPDAQTVEQQKKGKGSLKILPKPKTQKEVEQSDEGLMVTMTSKLKIKLGWDLESQRDFGKAADIGGQVEAVAGEQAIDWETQWVIAEAYKVTHTLGVIPFIKVGRDLSEVFNLDHSNSKYAKNKSALLKLAGFELLSGVVKELKGSYSAGNHSASLTFAPKTKKKETRDEDQFTFTFTPAYEYVDFLAVKLNFILGLNSTLWNLQRLHGVGGQITYKGNNPVLPNWDIGVGGSVKQQTITEYKGEFNLTLTKQGQAPKGLERKQWEISCTDDQKNTLQFLCIEQKFAPFKLRQFDFFRKVLGKTMMQNMLDDDHQISVKVAGDLGGQLREFVVTYFIVVAEELKLEISAGRKLNESNQGEFQFGMKVIYEYSPKKTAGQPEEPNTRSKTRKPPAKKA